MPGPFSVVLPLARKKPSEREADLRHRRARHTLRFCRKVCLLKNLKGGGRRELWVLVFRQCLREEKWHRDVEFEFRTFSGGKKHYKSRLLLSRLGQNQHSPARKDWKCKCPFDSQVTYLHRLAARVKHGLHVNRSVFRKSGFDFFRGDHNRGDYGHYKLLWSKASSRVPPREEQTGTREEASGKQKQVG